METATIKHLNWNVWGLRKNYLNMYHCKDLCLIFIVNIKRLQLDTSIWFGANFCCIQFTLLSADSWSSALKTEEGKFQFCHIIFYEFQKEVSMKTITKYIQKIYLDQAQAL